MRGSPEENDAQHIERNEAARIGDGNQESIHAVQIKVTWAHGDKPTNQRRSRTGQTADNDILYGPSLQPDCVDEHIEQYTEGSPKGCYLPCHESKPDDSQN